ncbi:glycerol kinase GlpK [Acetobacterium carbinolicum]|jgi:glycerol kinase (EC 2.7.1.30)|uniref:glycerol kinase GlpK n=1 Tax=Acetobacterium carbinolicum TaxID=52690 RepID=UPI0039C9B841
MRKKYVIGIDSGTTSGRALVIDKELNIVGIGQEEITQIYPKPGWVEHDANEIWKVVKNSIMEALVKARCTALDIEAIGITNQRETAIVWDLTTGQPVYNAIVWQDRRGADLCEDIKESEWGEIYRNKTGLNVDSYFSATKVKWIIENVPGVAEKAAKGEIAFGNVDTWLIYKLTGGKVFATDYSNAARSMLFNIHELVWDKEIMEHLGISDVKMADVRPSSGNFGETCSSLLGISIPICGDAGDQQAGLFGQACFNEGMSKMTYGTAGVFTLCTGKKPVPLDGLTASCFVGINNEILYEIEGVQFIVGAAVQWLRDGLKIIKKAEDTEAMAESVDSTGGVYFVPALSGLCAPYWDPYARGTIIGITGGTNENHMARATLESMAYQTRDVFDRYVQESGNPISSLRVDGGAVQNKWLMQFVADIVGVPVLVPNVSEATALGAAWLAGMHTGFWSGLDELSELWKPAAEYKPKMTREEANGLYGEWLRAVERSRSWVARGIEA